MVQHALLLFQNENTCLKPVHPVLMGPSCHIRSNARSALLRGFAKPCLSRRLRLGGGHRAEIGAPGKELRKLVRFKTVLHIQAYATQVGPTANDSPGMSRCLVRFILRPGFVRAEHGHQKYILIGCDFGSGSGCCPCSYS